MARNRAAAGSRTRVAVLGAFGIENFGNEATLEATMCAITRSVDAEDIVCICSVPDDVARRFGVDADYLHGPPSPEHGGMRLGRSTDVMTRVRRELARLLGAYRQMQDVDVLVVAGTGALDDQHIGPGGLPLDMAIWCLAGRAAGARVAMLSVGAGPITSRLSRLLLRAAAGTAHYISYRDDLSRDYMRSIGRNVCADRVAPDLALGLSNVEHRQHPDRLTGSVAIGVMWSGNWRHRREYATYVARLVDVVTGLWREDNRVVLMIGDRADTESRDHVLTALAGIDEEATRSSVDVPRIDSFDDVLRVVGSCDVAVVSRYHHIVAALLTSTPVLSLEYGFKNRALMGDVDLGESCLEIDDFDPVDVVHRVKALQDRGVDESVEDTLEDFRARLAEQYSTVLGATDEPPQRLVRRDIACQWSPGCTAK